MITLDEIVNGRFQEKVPSFDEREVDIGLLHFILRSRIYEVFFFFQDFEIPKNNELNIPEMSDEKKDEFALKLADYVLKQRKHLNSFTFEELENGSWFWKTES